MQVQQSFSVNKCLRARASVLVLAVCVCGCGGGPYPVAGEVVWADGSPARELAGSHVVFELTEKGTSARGIIQADGSFQLTTTRPGDGALPGEHKVLVLENRKAIGPEGASAGPAIMNERFGNFQSSGLQATVKPGSNRVKLAVERASRR